MFADFRNALAIDASPRRQSVAKRNGATKREAANTSGPWHPKYGIFDWLAGAF